MTVMVIGGVGLIGSNVVRRLVQEHDDKVVVFDRVREPGGRSPLSDLGDKVEYIVGSVTDPTLVLRTIKTHDVESVVHLAALIGGEATARPIEALDINIMGTAHVLEAARIAQLRRVVVMSSSAVMGGPEDLVTPRKEEDIVLPTTGIYPLSKLTAELIVHSYREIYGVDAVALRPRGVFGPGIAQKTHKHAVPELVRVAVAGEDVVRPDGAGTTIDLTYVKDEAHGIVQALKAPKPLPRHVYNLSQGKNVSLGEVATILAGLFPKQRFELGEGTGSEILTKGVQRDLTYRQSLRPPQDVSRAHEDFGYTPAWPVERSIPDYVNWLQTGDYGEID